MNADSSSKAERDGTIYRVVRVDGEFERVDEQTLGRLRAGHLPTSDYIRGADGGLMVITPDVMARLEASAQREAEMGLKGSASRFDLASDGSLRGFTQTAAAHLSREAQSRRAERVDESDGPDMAAPRTTPADRTAEAQHRAVATVRDQGDRAHTYPDVSTAEGQAEVLDAMDLGVSGSSAEMSAQLFSQVAQAREDYIMRLRDSGVIDGSPSELSASDRMGELSIQHQIHALQMTAMCMYSLRSGMGAQSVVRTVGMAASMWAFSPTFRLMTKSVVEKGQGKIAAVLSERAMKKRDAQWADLSEEHDRYVLDGVEVPPELEQRIKVFRDEERLAARGGEAWTAQSAALTEVGLAEAAYVRMRTPDADGRMPSAEVVQVIQDQYEDLVSRVRAECVEDDIDLDDVDRSARVLVGERISADPEVASCYEGLSCGDFRRSPMRPVVTSNGQRGMYWDGSFEDMAGSKVSSGMFPLRAPEKPTEHEARISDVMLKDMLLSKDMGELHHVMLGYGAAWSMHENSALLDRLGDDDLADRARGGALMLNSMADDGIDESTQRLSYASAYMSSLERLATLQPQIAQQWEATYGKSWREDFAAYVVDPADKVERSAQQADDRARAAYREKTRHFTESMSDAGVGDAGEAKDRGDQPEP